MGKAKRHMRKVVQRRVHARKRRDELHVAKRLREEKRRTDEIERDR